MSRYILGRLAQSLVSLFVVSVVVFALVRLSGDPIAIASYLGKSDKFERSISDFSERYADQNEKDYQAFADAVRSGRLEATEGL